MSNIKIFISHSSIDSGIIDEFIDDVLKLSLHLTSEDIAFTSREDMGVPPGGNIDEYLRNNIEQAQLVFLMISENFKKSEVCLNEMGAAWAYGKIKVPILLPNTPFSQLGWLLSFDKAIRINNEESLDSLYDTISAELHIPEISITEWNKNKKKFMAFCVNNNPQPTAPYAIPAPEQTIPIVIPAAQPMHVQGALIAFDSEFVVRGVVEGEYQFQIDIRLRAETENITIKKIELHNNNPFTEYLRQERKFLPLNCFVPMNILSIREIGVKDYIKEVEDVYAKERINTIDYTILKGQQVSLSFHGLIPTIRESDGYDDLERKNWTLHIHYNINEESVIPLNLTIIKGTYNAYWG